MSVIFNRLTANELNNYENPNSNNDVMFKVRLRQKKEGKTTEKTVTNLPQLVQ